MSDSRLRSLERRWELTRSQDDEGRLLREQVRLGSLERTRVGLAAHYGYAAARIALGWAPYRQRPLREWVEGLSAFGKEPTARAALAAARFVYPLWTNGFSPAGRAAGLDGEWVTMALRAAEAWVLAPSEETAQSARHGASLADDAVVESDLEPDDAGALAARSCEFAAHFACEGGFEDAWRSIECAVDAEDGVAIRDAIVDEVVPWALGHHDPIRRWRT